MSSVTVQPSQGPLCSERKDARGRKGWNPAGLWLALAV